jgi:hypothetical protein
MRPSSFQNEKSFLKKIIRGMPRRPKDGVVGTNNYPTTLDQAPNTKLLMGLINWVHFSYVARSEHVSDLMFTSH